MEGITLHQITITGLVFQHEGESPPDCWDVEAVISELISGSVSVSSVPMSPANKQKRAYKCSICGGRHAATHCPHKDDDVIKEGGE